MCSGSSLICVTYIHTVIYKYNAFRALKHIQQEYEIAYMHAFRNMIKYFHIREKAMLRILIELLQGGTI